MFSFLKRLFLKVLNMLMSWVLKLNYYLLYYVIYPLFGINPNLDLTEEKPDKVHILLTLRPKDPSELSDLELYTLKGKLLDLSLKNNMICMTSIYGKTEDNKDVCSVLKSTKILTDYNIEDYTKELTKAVFSFKDTYDVKYIYFITVRIKLITL